MKTFAIGDIHGGYRALVQCLERSGFIKDIDQLITLGDICDGWPEVYECVEELLTIPHRIDLVGNHDEWFTAWLDSGIHVDYWKQGGRATAESYLRVTNREHLIMPSRTTPGFITALNPEEVPPQHYYFFKHQHLYYIDADRNMFFVHAGFNRKKSLKDNKRLWPYLLTWDRDLWNQALSCKGKQKIKTVEKFKHIFIGHTTCSRIDECRPVTSGGVTNLDTGAGWEGKLTIIDVDTKEYWQSDVVKSLYPNIKGR